MALWLKYTEEAGEDKDSFVLHCTPKTDVCPALGEEKEVQASMLSCTRVEEAVTDRHIVQPPID
jgi:hypothetical protein